MLRSIKDLSGYPVQAKNGEVGKCVDLLFDDEQWTVRYLVVNTGNWLLGQRVLISVYSLGKPDLGEDYKSFPVNLNCEEVKNAPPLSKDQPVSRRYEQELARHYAYPIYWQGGGLWGYEPYPVPTANPVVTDMEQFQEEMQDIEKCHLRSAQEVMGYHIEAEDGEIGHVEDFIVHTRSWSLRQLVIDTRNWLPGKKVLLPPKLVESIDWNKRTAKVARTREQIQSAPEFDSHAPVNQDLDGKLYDYYGLPVEDS